MTTGCRKLAAALVLAAALGGCSDGGPAPAKPMNVLFITADDLGPMLSSYGETLIRTPNIDALAAGGVRFETAYVAQASCSPSRSAMFTGMYVHSTGQYGLTNGGFTLHEELRDKTMPNLLKKAGYRTGIIGKLHVAPEESFQFDYRPKVNARVVRDVAGLADRFLAEGGAQPFFLMVNYSDPHAFRKEDDPRDWHFPPQVDGLPENPLPPGERTIFAAQQTDAEGHRVRTAGYYNAIERLDVGVGLLMEVIERRGLAGNTLVVFVGDHGPPFARGKTTVYEFGVRVPFLVRWPGVSQPGLVSKAMVSTVDILPTVLDATGQSIPANVQGRSLRPVLGAPEATWREYLAAEFHFHGRRPFYPRRAIRDQRYKLIHNLLAGRAKPSTTIDACPGYKIAQEARYRGTPVAKAFETFGDPPEFELYDLSEDPIEFHNLAGDPAHRGTLERLQRALLDWRKQTNDPFLDPTYVDKYVEYAKPE